MNYEEKYKQAIERMKSWVRGEHPECFCEAQKAAEFIFPELKESDEKVREDIISLVNEFWERIGSINPEYSSRSRMLDWLEKQGKRLGADEVTKHQWISVEDELPPMRDEDGMSAKVLTHSKGGGIYMNHYDYRHKTWGNPLAFNVTHWMPLPPPPHHIIDANKKVDRVIGTADHIKTALDVLNKKGGEK